MIEYKTPNKFDNKESKTHILITKKNIAFFFPNVIVDLIFSYYQNNNYISKSFASFSSINNLCVHDSKVIYYSGTYISTFNYPDRHNLSEIYFRAWKTFDNVMKIRKCADNIIIQYSKNFLVIDSHFTVHYLPCISHYNIVIDSVQQKMSQNFCINDTQLIIFTYTKFDNVCNIDIIDINEKKHICNENFTSDILRNKNIKILDCYVSGALIQVDNDLYWITINYDFIRIDHIIKSDICSFVDENINIIEFNNIHSYDITSGQYMYTSKIIFPEFIKDYKKCTKVNDTELYFAFDNTIINLVQE